MIKNDNKKENLEIKKSSILFYFCYNVSVMNENEEKIVDVEIIKDDKKSKMSSKEKRNAIIICSAGALILLGTIAIPVIGHFADQISPSKKSSPSFSWDNQMPGLYTENGLFRTNTDVFSLEKDGERYAVSGIKATNEDKYLIMPSAVTISSENKTYNIDNVKENEVNVFNSKDIKIKGVYFSYVYTGIGSNAFRYMSELEEVKFGSGDGSEHIDSFAFADNQSLKSITFSKNLTTLGIGAFENDVSLEKVDLLNTKLTNIYKQCFSGCTSLKEINLPSTITSIPENLFAGCSSLTSINYASTTAAWANLSKADNWNKDSAIKNIVCTDGTLSL